MRDIKELDCYLTQTIEYLIKNWYNEETGIVACALIDDDKVIFATSSKNGDYWTHAERNAYTKFKRLYGEPSSNATFIITLSPCIIPLKYRSESSCSQFITSFGINRIHFGVLDTLHAESISVYKEMGFIATFTENINNKKICSNLMALFAKYHSRINEQLPAIKKELGNSFFDSFLSKKAAYNVQTNSH